MMKNYGFIKTAVASPKLKVANPEYNLQQILELIEVAEQKKTAVIVFPELSITSYTCADLFNQRLLLDHATQSLATLLQMTTDYQILSIIGMPLLIDDRLYNCAVAIQSGKIKGVVPKMFIPNYKEFYEKRWFASGYTICKTVTSIQLLGEQVPFGNLIFKSIDCDFSLGIEICEDVWAPLPPSSLMFLNGATMIANLSASTELVSKSDYRRQLVSQQSARGMCAYLYASAGVHESTTDVVFGGDSFIFENGSFMACTKPFDRGNQIAFADIDVQRLNTERMSGKSFGDSIDCYGCTTSYQKVSITYPKLDYVPDKTTLDRRIDRNPFVPANPFTKHERCQEIFNIQVAGLSKRLEHTGMKKAVIGISGGLDSTLALLVTVKAFETLEIPVENIVAITMPGFGTTDKTYDNAVNLMKALHVTIKEKNIIDACLQHFKDIEHNPDLHDVTYENTQARERTQILMDYANKIGGLVIGTGDLSELALGWCTYNGDHMSMYAVNASVPKTLVQHLIRWYMEIEAGKQIRDTLVEVLDTPISPELLPPDKNGGIQQKTEDLVGPYELHDFFMYHSLRFGSAPNKVLFLAQIAFAGAYSNEDLLKWLNMYYRRFFSQQFKRSCLPDGPKVGSVSLSPRGDWRMPSDADASIWLQDLNQ